MVNVFWMFNPNWRKFPFLFTFLFFFLQMSWNHQLDKVHTVNSSDWALGHWDGHGQGIFWTVFVFNNGSTPLTARQNHTFWWEPSSTDIVNRLSCKTLHFEFQWFCGSTNHMSWFWHLTYTADTFFSKQFPRNKKTCFLLWPETRNAI